MNTGDRDERGRFIKSSKFKVGYIKRDELINIVKLKNQEIYEKDQEIESLKRDKDKLITAVFIMGAILCGVLIILSCIRFV